jgi:site-specific DNA-methyltransferase (adenine-specific)
MELLLGDCKNKLKELEDNSIDAIVTDPPYGLSFMGKKWDYDVPSIDIWKECLRVLKPGGYLLSFAGTRTQHRMAVNIEDAGFEIRDMIAWVYGSGFPKSLNIGKAVDKLQGNEREDLGEHEPFGREGRSGSGKAKFGVEGWDTKPKVHLTKGTSQWEGWGTALKPALEPITVARKPLGEKTVAENCLKWGVGGINIDGCRVGFDMSNKEDVHAVDQWARQSKSGVKVFNQEGSAKLQEFNQKAPTGRFPANLIHDGSDEVVGLFPNTKSTPRTPTNGGTGGVGVNTNFQRGNETSEYADSGSASRFFYCAKASKRERNIGCEDIEDKAVISTSNGGRENVKMTVGGASLKGENKVPEPTKNNHPTVKPIALMEYLVKLVSREGQVVLDPFMGSGTTGMACKKLNREFIGIEMMPEYMEIAKARIDGVKENKQLEQLNLLKDNK